MDWLERSAAWSWSAGSSSERKKCWKHKKSSLAQFPLLSDIVIFTNWKNSSLSHQSVLFNLLQEWQSCRGLRFIHQNLENEDLHWMENSILFIFGHWCHSESNIEFIPSKSMLTKVLLDFYLKNIVVLSSKSFQDSKVPRYFSSEKSGAFFQNIICRLWETREVEGQSGEFENIFSVDHHPRHQCWFADPPQLIHHVPAGVPDVAFNFTRNEEIIIW